MEFFGQSNSNKDGQQQTADFQEQYEQEEQGFDFEIDIPSKQEPNMLIDYMDNTVNNYLLYKKIDQEPQYYLNFGFNLNDYSAFLIKQTYMRAERKVIEERIRKIKGEDTSKGTNANEDQS